jgi:hypothetical protein
MSADDLVQVGLAFFGLTSLAMVQGHNATARRWAPVVGIVGQPFWAVFAYSTGAKGLGLLVVAYTINYGYGIWVQWRKGSC